MADFYFNGIERVAATDKRIKILYTIPNFDTAGSGKALLNIAKRLDARRFEPHILCMHDRGHFFQTVRDSGIPVHVWNYTTPMKPYHRGIWSCWKLSRQLKEIYPDIIHSFHYSADYSEALSAWMAGIKWIYTKKSMSWGGSSRNAWKLRTFLATGVIAQNLNMMQEFFPGKIKAHLIPRGVDTIAFAPGKRNEVLRSQYGVSENERIIICVANLVPVKGVEILIEAFERLTANHEAWKVWVVGDDRIEYAQRLKQYVIDQQLSDRITFIGQQKEVKPFLDQAEIFVLPTRGEGRMEGSPVALLEAMANGKVVIGSDIPGIRDQLKDFKENLVPDGDSRALATCLNNWMSRDTKDNISYGLAFRKHAVNHFDIAKEVEDHSGFYLSMMQ